jgi:hypothetical protein
MSCHLIVTALFMQRKSYFEAKSESFLGLATQFSCRIIARDCKVLDPMHSMKNVCHFLILHLQGVKDTNFEKDDLEESNTKHMLW